MTNGTITVRNSYNPDGARIAKIVNRSNGSETHRYTYNGGKLVYDIIRINKEGTISNLTILMSYDESGRPFMITYANVSYYYLLNAQGDVVGIMNVSGDIMVEYTYDAWGNVLSITGPMASTMGQHNQLRYRGYVYDPETGLYFLNSRFYDPEKGRFINADALTSTGGLLGNNMFAYCINNPVRYRDSAGLAPVETNMTDDPIDDLMDQNEGGGGGGGSTTGNASGGGGSGYGGTGYGGVGTSGGGTGYGGGGTSGGGNGSGSTPGGLGGSVVGGNITGYGHAPNQGVPGSTYTQISSDGKATVVSQTTYNEHGLRGQRIDYAGRDHNVGLPHIHRISYIYIENMPYKSGEIIERYFGDEEG